MTVTAKTNHLFLIDTQGLLIPTIGLLAQAASAMQLNYVSSCSLEKPHESHLYYLFDNEEAYDVFFDRYIRKTEIFNGLIITLYLNKNSTSRLHEMSDFEWNTQVVDQLKHIFLLSQLAVDEYLARNCEGKITFLIQSNDDLAAQVLKNSLYAFCRSIAKEYGHRRVYCNSVYNTSLPGLHGEALNLALYFTMENSTFINGEVITLGSISSIDLI